MADHVTQEILQHPDAMGKADRVRMQGHVEIPAAPVLRREFRPPVPGQRIGVLQTQLSDSDRAAASKSAATFHAAPLNRSANVPPEAADLGA